MLITSERLVLRRFRAADAGVLAAYRSDPEVARYQSWTAPVSIEEAQRLVRAFEQHDPATPGWFQWAIERTGDHALIGDVGVGRVDNGRPAEIGFTLARAYHGQGYAAEAVTAVLRHLFTVDGLHKVEAEADARNTASARLLERVGFTREGLRRQHTWMKGEWTDDLLYGLLAADWHRFTNR